MAESKALTPRALTPQRQRFVNEYLAGKTAAEAARLASYSASYSKKAAAFLLTQPDIKAAIEAAQGKMQKTINFTIEDAVADAHAKAELWKDKNPMASLRLQNYVPASWVSWSKSCTCKSRRSTLARCYWPRVSAACSTIETRR